VLVFGAGGLLWLLVPFLNKSPGHSRRKLAFTFFGVLVVIYIAVMTVIGYLT
jgi:quinol-cytochrome oxidoreductase complex cytochrome b subunit